MNFFFYHKNYKVQIAISNLSLPCSFPRDVGDCLHTGCLRNTSQFPIYFPPSEFIDAEVPPLYYKLKLEEFYKLKVIIYKIRYF